MTTTPPDTSPHQGPPDTGPGVGWDDIRDLGRLRRSRTDRKVAGVAGGLGRHLDVDPVILRVAFVVLTFFGGVGLLLYVALWLLLPEEGSDWGKIKLDRRSRTVALVIVGALAVLLLFSHGWWGGGDGGLFFLCLVIVLAAVVVSQVLPKRGGRDVVPGPGPGEPNPYARDAAPGVATDLSASAETTATLTAAPPPPSYVVPEQPRPVNPRKRGPILFGYGVAVMAVALGALLVADLAGANVAPSAYPATVLALSGVMLVLGAFWGRAGGLILVGLLAWPATAVTTAVDKWDVHRVVETPASASEVQSSYQMDNGELVVDLSEIRDVDALDGRTIHVQGDVGHLDIRVPRSVNVVAHLDIDGPGGISAFGTDEGGFGHETDIRHDVAPDAPTLTIDAQLDVGAIDLHTEGTR